MIAESFPAGLIPIRDTASEIFGIWQEGLSTPQQTSRTEHLNGCELLLIVYESHYHVRALSALPCNVYIYAYAVRFHMNIITLWNSCIRKVDPPP